MLRKLSICGMISPIICLLNIILGGILWKGYSHLQQPISDLTAAGAPTRALLNNILSISVPFNLVFMFSAYFYFKEYSNKLVNISMLMMIIVQICSFSYTFFPEDLKGATMTLQVSCTM